MRVQLNSLLSMVRERKVLTENICGVSLFVQCYKYFIQILGPTFV